MSLSATSSMPISLFLSYASEDKGLLEKLLAQLSGLQRLHVVRYWYNDYTTPGDVYQSEAAAYLQSASIILLIISPGFMQSDQCWREMELAMEQRKNGDAQVIPVLLKPVSGWEQTCFGELTPLPANKKPIAAWKDRDLACANVVDSISAFIKKISIRQQRSHRRMRIEHPPGADPQTRLREHAVKEIYERLVAPDTTAVALTGIPGAGLTTLANLIYHYAEGQRHSRNGQFTAEALKLSIDHTTTMLELAETIMEALGEALPDDPFRSPRNLAALLFRTLNEAERPRLLILDQFEALLEQERGTDIAEDITEWLRLLHTSPCRCRVLLVSHSRINGMHEAHYMREYHTDGLETEEGVAYLKIWGIAASSSDLQAVVEGLGGHALALRQLAPLLSSQRPTVAAFLQENALQTPLEHIAHAIEHIYTQQLDSLQRALLLAFAVYREPVPLDAALLDKSVVNAVQSSALKGLQTLYLLQEDDGRYRLPALVARYAYSRYADERNEQEGQSALCKAHEQAAAYYQQVSDRLPHQPPDSVTIIHNGVEAIWHLCQAQQWQRAYTFMAQANVFPALLRGGHSQVLLELYQQFVPAEKWHAQPQQLAHLLKEAGEAYDRLGRKREAQQHFEQALPLFQAVRDRRNEAATLTHLGEVYNALEQKEQALTCYQQALRICNEEGAEDEHVKAIVLNDLGKICYEMGQKARALEYYEQALLLHDDVSEEATTFNNLAGLYEDMGKMTEAYRYYQKALRFFQEIRDLRGEASVLHNLGLYWRKQGKRKEALEYYESAWHHFREIGDRWSESVTLRNLGQLHLVQEQYRSALACLFLARKLLQEMQSPQQNDLQGTIALLSHQLGKEDFEEIWKYFEVNDPVVVESIVNDAGNS
jgi:tetratricopeptide (TPR) repeat protein